jgi:hypothetical protein
MMYEMVFKFNFLSFLRGESGCVSYFYLYIYILDIYIQVKGYCIPPLDTAC